MALNNAQDAPHAARLLDQAYEALLRSDYAALPGLSADLESELQNPKDKMTEASLQVLRQKANRNASVLLAASAAFDQPGVGWKICDPQPRALSPMTAADGGQKSARAEIWRSVSENFAQIPSIVSLAISTLLFLQRLYRACIPGGVARPGQSGRIGKNAQSAIASDGATSCAQSVS